MNLPGQNRVLYHAIAIPIAVLASWALLSAPIFRDDSAPMQGQDTLDYPLHGYLANFDGYPFLSDALHKTLTDGSSILLMGSSELTSADHPSKPVRFFNNELNVPLVAIGHAYNQSFSIYAQLLATGADLTNARVAILVSPTWFFGKEGKRGSNLASFLEYQPSPSLYRIQQLVKDRDTLATPVPAYLYEHIDELGSTQPIVQWLTRDGSWRSRALYSFSEPWYAEVIRRTRPEMLAEQPVSLWTPEPRQHLTAERWKELYKEGIAEHLAQCTNNSVYVYDEYYTEYVKGETRKLEAEGFEKNREMHDLLRLLNYVQAKGGRPFFIIQPLNPYVYTNLKEMTPIVDWVRGQLDQRDLPYLDLWVDDTTQFRPGTLTDVMHLGPLGWYRVDSAMNAYFR